MKQTIKAIQTVYNGYKFRSRLEARWAVFFDALGINYEYEPEGYDLGEAGWYLPDFYLTDMKVWVEIKGGNKDADFIPGLNKAGAFYKKTGNSIAFCMNDPSSESVILFSSVFTSDAPEVVKPVALKNCYFGLHLTYEGMKEFCEYCKRYPNKQKGHLDFFDSRAKPIIEYDISQVKQENIEFSNLFNTRVCVDKQRVEIVLIEACDVNLMLSPDGKNYYNRNEINRVLSPRLNKAYTISRQARFEHGETPRVKP